MQLETQELQRKRQILDHENSDEYEAAVAAYLGALSREGVQFSSPGPGSPVRWMLYGVQSVLYPESQWPQGYPFESLGTESRDALNALAKFYSKVSTTDDSRRIPKRARFHIGWKVGKWNCESSGAGADVLAITDRAGNLLYPPWRGSLRPIIRKSKSLTDFLRKIGQLSGELEGGLSLSGEKNIALVVDVSLGLSAEHEGIQFGDWGRIGRKGDASKESSSLFRAAVSCLTRWFRTSVTILPKLIGSPSNKAVYTLRKFGMVPTTDGVWRSTECPDFVALEARPSVCSEEIRSNDPELDGDRNEALTCAKIGYLYIADRASSLQPSPALVLRREGWIWKPR